MFIPVLVNLYHNHICFDREINKYTIIVNILSDNETKHKSECKQKTGYYKASTQCKNM